MPSYSSPAPADVDPGIVAYLCHWYTRYQTGLRITIVWSVGTIIGAASYILAYMFNLGSDGLSGLSGWVIIFITVSSSQRALSLS